MLLGLRLIQNCVSLLGSDLVRRERTEPLLKAYVYGLSTATVTSRSFGE